MERREENGRRGKGKGREEKGKEKEKRKGEEGTSPSVAHGTPTVWQGHSQRTVALTRAEDHQQEGKISRQRP